MVTVTEQDIEANIASEYYFTAADGRVGQQVAHVDPLRCLTFCVLVLKNGFTVTGASACASPETFDAKAGRKLARERAVNKTRVLMIYERKSKLAERPTDYRDRVRLELSELTTRMEALYSFIGSEGFLNLERADQDLLHSQYHHMYLLRDVLQRRIARF